MIEVSCAECGVKFGLTEHLHARRHEDHATFCCPNGHHNHYPRPKVTEEQKQIQQLEQIRTRDARHYQTLHSTLEEWKRAARICPICEERVTTAQYVETIRVKVAEHLRNEHGAKQRLRAITERATA